METLQVESLLGESDSLSAVRLHAIRMTRIARFLLQDSYGEALMALGRRK